MNNSQHNSESNQQQVDNELLHSDNNENSNSAPSLQQILSSFEQCIDLVHQSFQNNHVDIVYLVHLTDKQELFREVINPLSLANEADIERLFSENLYQEATDSEFLINEVLDGSTAIFHRQRAYYIKNNKCETRSIDKSETETVITGPHESFVESASTNLSIIRRRVKSSKLKTIKLQVGEVTKTDVYILYIDGIANMDYLQEFIKRIELIEIDAVHDSNMLIQLIDDVPNSLFPLFLTTERTDTAVSKLVCGRIIGILDGSPSIFSAPSAFFEFFSSPDDYYQRWIIGTSTRLLRLVALCITLTFTALYVSTTTFHYEMIPEALLLTLTESRSKVPFPPLYEALLMEVTIELLREAGARLPTKIGQTIGIVGGIVIGQAAVQAGLTSNVLIIAVASSAIASFVIPSYVMSASIRLIRFGLIILAGTLGDLGIAIGITYLIIHLSGLTSLNTSYLTPVAPTNFKDWLDVLIRAPFWALKSRPSQVNTSNKIKSRQKK